MAGAMLLQLRVSTVRRSRVRVWRDCQGLAYAQAQPGMGSMVDFGQCHIARPLLV